MAGSAFNTSRRSLIAALSAAPVVIAAPALAATPNADPDFSQASEPYTREEYDAAREKAGQIAYLHMARAWMDRWKALGGSVGLTFREGQPKAHRGMLLALEYWTPTDEGRDDIRPHTWITDKEHHAGAVKALEGLLELSPGLANAVQDIISGEAFTDWARRKEGA